MKLTDDMIIAIYNELYGDMIMDMGEFMHENIDDHSGKLMVDIDIMNFSSFDKYVMLNRSGEYFSFNDTDDLRYIIEAEHDYMNNLKKEEN